VADRSTKQPTAILQEANRGNNFPLITSPTPRLRGQARMNAEGEAQTQPWKRVLQELPEEAENEFRRQSRSDSEYEQK